ncbi:ankyrin repeat family protein [Prunus dulcis]|uniref:Ankyrin repeat family protein n=1 Tax=Prunus dulcis TaxID=3755 RepID=A0A4Y1QXL4_PRUDU|nr:ankyrin repeat family protein [Prunus dulcis]
MTFSFMFSFNYKLIFVLSLAFNLTNLKSRGYPDEELSEQEKSRTTQEQGNSKLNFRKLHCTGVVLPPITKRPAGRPPTKRIKASHTIFLLLYVNDIVVTGSDSTHLQQLICLLGGHFDTKDLGSLSYFLGLQAFHKDDTLYINQLKYAYDLLQKANLLNSKPTSTPLAA